MWRQPLRLSSRADDWPATVRLYSQDPKVFQFDQLFNGQILEAVLACFLDEFRSDSLHLRSDDVVDARLKSRRLQRFDEPRSHALYFHANNLVRTGMEAQRANIANVFRRDALHFHSYHVV